MSELSEIAAELEQAAANNQSVVLATVVRTEGSVYRRMGARMVVRADDTTYNAVSGGCLEADIVARAAKVRASGVPMLVTYDTRSAEDIVWGFGLGCQGVVEILLEPLAGERLNAARHWYADCAESDTPRLLATVIRSGPGAPNVGESLSIYGVSAEIVVGVGGGSAALASISGLVETARDVLDAGRSCVRQFAAANGESFECALEVIAPPISLLICGAGHDAVPLARLARELGWRVTVVDHRAGYARPERFPGATVRHWPETASLIGSVIVGPRTAAVVMSHNYERDRAYLAAILPTNAPYVGMLGPRRRTEQLLCELEEQDINVSPEDRARIHAPIGLDLGSESPAEIALSIVGEIAAVMRGASARPLRDCPGPIHRPAPDTDAPPADDAASRVPLSVCPTSA